MLTSLARRNADAPNKVVPNADVAAAERQDVRLESAVRTLSAEPVVSVVRWSTKNEAAAGLDRAASRLDAAENFGPIGRAGMVGERGLGAAVADFRSELGSVNSDAALDYVVRQPSSCGRDVAGLFSPQALDSPLTGCPNPLPEGGVGSTFGAS